MSVEFFRVRDGALDEFIAEAAENAGFDVSRGVEGSGFVPTLRNVLKAISGDYNDYKQYALHPNDMATQVAWVVYYFVAQRDGLERPMDFVPKSIIAEAVDGPAWPDAVRISLWSERAQSQVASNGPIGIDSFKHPDGIPASYAPARSVLDNLFEIVVDEANKLIPFARAIATQARSRE